MGRAKGPRKISRCTAEFKVKGVKLSEISGVLIQDVADALDIHPFMLSRWRKECREGRLRARAGVTPGLKQVKELKELSSLKREYSLLREEHELLREPSGSVPHEGRELRGEAERVLRVAGW